MLLRHCVVHPILTSHPIFHSISHSSFVLLVQAKHAFGKNTTHLHIIKWRQDFFFFLLGNRQYVRNETEIVSLD